MILVETIFIADAPVGVIRMDTFSKQIAFSPIKGKSRLPDREWTSVDEIKAAVIREYEKENDQAVAP